MQVTAGSADQGPWRPVRGVPAVRRATLDDLWAALAAGLADFRAAPLPGLATGAIYMAGGWLLLYVLEVSELRGLSFALVAGFALIGPFAATILYEVSRRREQGLGFGWGELGAMLRGTARRQILYLGVALMLWLALWSRVALTLYWGFFGWNPQPFGELLETLLTTWNGIWFLLLGHAFGAMFAVVAFCMTVVAFPFLVDRDADMVTAIITSFRTVLASPLVMAVWAAVIAVILAIASAALFLGLPLALPLLGHASWHLYRRLVEA